jgi:hypothetical protein
MFFEQSGRLLPLSVGHSLEVTATQPRLFFGAERATFRNTSYEPQLLISKFLLPFGSGLSASHKSPTFILTLQSRKFLPLSRGHSLLITATQVKVPGAFVVVVVDGADVVVVVVVVLVVVLVVEAERATFRNTS